MNNYFMAQAVKAIETNPAGNSSTKNAHLYAQLAQAEALTRIADALELMMSVTSDGKQANLRVDTGEQ